MTVRDIIKEIERVAPLPLQEGFDNAGVQAGNIDRTATGALLCLDVTEATLDEALAKGCNLLISHHPLLFKPFKSLTGSSYIERCLIKACKHDLVIYAAHTNLDNAWDGVNHHLGEKIGLQDMHILSPQKDALQPAGSGIVGNLPGSEGEEIFLLRIKALFRTGCIKHSPLTGKAVRRVAVCGGSGAFLIAEAIAAEADVFITGEAKYNDFYDVEDKILLAVIGHYESEICTKDIFHRIISNKFPTFALHLSDVNANPVNYL